MYPTGENTVSKSSSYNRFRQRRFHISVPMYLQLFVARYHLSNFNWWSQLGEFTRAIRALYFMAQRQIQTHCQLSHI